jgi:hypothetical protein
MGECNECGSCELVEAKCQECYGDGCQDCSYSGWSQWHLECDSCGHVQEA